jgi:hypothetical protein
MLEIYIARGRQNKKLNFSPLSHSRICGQYHTKKMRPYRLLKMNFNP